MATSPETYRRAQAALSVRATADLRKAWPKLLTMRPDNVAEALALVLEEVTDKYGPASASLAADWFEEMRDVSSATGSHSAWAAELPSKERLEILSRWGVGPLFGESPSPLLALSKVAGGLSRQVLDAGRDTLMYSMASDPSSPRYARHASANACAFCGLMASRGAVYSSSANALGVTGENLGGKDYRKGRRLSGGREISPEIREDILRGSRAETIRQGGRRGRSTQQAMGEKYHDECRCTAVPVWPGDSYEPAPYVKKWHDAYAEAPPGSSGSLKETLSSMRDTLDTN